MSATSVVNSAIRKSMSDADSIQKTIKTHTVTNPVDHVATNDKILKGVMTQPSTTASKSFEVYSTKRVVEEKNFDSAIDERSKINQLPDSTIKAIEKNSGIPITSDTDLKRAVAITVEDMENTNVKSLNVTSRMDHVSAKLGVDFMATSADGAVHGLNTAVDSVNTAVDSAVSTISKPLVIAGEYVGNIGSTIGNALPDGMDMDTFDKFSGTFEKALRMFNICDGASNMFDGIFFNLSGTLQWLLDFLGIAGLFDMSWLFDCFPELTSKLDMKDKTGIIDNVANNGGVLSVTSLTDMYSDSPIMDPVGLAISMVNKTDTPLIDISVDNAVQSLGVDKTRVFDRNYKNNSRNVSPLDTLSLPIYKLDEIKTLSNDNSEASRYFLDDHVHDLLINVPTHGIA